MGMGFKFQMGMGMKSLKWEGIGTKNLFPHTSNVYQSVKVFYSGLSNLNHCEVH